jgi:hypothetical protein
MVFKWDGMEVGGGMQGPVLCEPGGLLNDTRLVKPEHSSFYTGLHGYALLDVSFTSDKTILLSKLDPQLLIFRQTETQLHTK